MPRHEYRQNSSFQREETMDLFIETLTGTSFEITVSPFDTVISIKLKIQRVEGIPVNQQHLIYNMQELIDSSCLFNYSISHGATLKLVLSMRGGPISTRRLPILDDIGWKELRDLIEGSREDMLDLPIGSHVTVLVFSDSDRENLLKIVENEDGTHSPISDSLSGTSLRNLFAEDDPEEEDEFYRRLQENSTTMMKMLDLRAKMDELSLQKRPKKCTKYDLLVGQSGESRDGTHTGQLSEPRNINREFHTDRSNRSFHSLPSGSRSEQEFLLTSSKQNFLGSGNKEWSSFANSSSVKRCEYRYSRQNLEAYNHNGNEQESTDECNNSVSSTVSNLLDASRRRMNQNLSNLGILPNLKQKIENDYGCSRESVKSIVNESKSDRELNLQDSHIQLVSSSDVAVLKEPETVVTEVPEISSTPRPISVTSHKETAVLVSAVPNNTITTSINNNYRLVILGEENHSKASPDKLTEHQKSTQKLCSILNDTKWHHLNHQVNLLSARSSNLDLIDSEASNFRQQRQLHSAGSEAVLSSSRQTPLLNTVTRTEKLGRRRSTHNPFNLHQNSNTNEVNTISQNKLDSDMIPSNIRNHLPPQLIEEKFPVLCKSSSDHASLPLEKLSKTNKNIKTRCCVCRKRLNITNIYTCRCEKLFCSVHRYSELHECTYDYKEEGRKILQQANPLVAASKLSKI